MTTHQIISLAEGITAAIAALRLISLGLANRFSALLTWLVAESAINFLFGTLDPSTALYFWMYFTLEPAKCVFEVLAVRELFALVFAGYPGIRSGGRWVMYAAIGISLSISAGVTASLWTGTASGRSFSHLYYLQTTQRSVLFGLTIVIVTILVFLSKYPLHLSRNILVSSACFSILFLSEALEQFIDVLQPNLRLLSVDYGESYFMAFCLLAWALLLRPESEYKPQKISFSTPQEERLLAQLNALNQLMTRSARR